MNAKSTAEQVRDLISQGESSRVEFKSSLRWDHQQSRVNKELTKVVVRTLAAFLNSHGGTVLLGVQDDGAVVGIEDDLTTLSGKGLDGFERTLRGALASHLGDEIDPYIRFESATVGNKTVALASCSAHSTAVYFKDGNERTLCVRSGNLTRALDAASAVAYVASHWPVARGVTDEQLRSLIAEALDERLPQPAAQATERREQVPHWMSLATRRVLDLFLANLSRAHGWKRLSIVSPWISEIGGPLATLSFDQMLRRLKADRTTAYVVTRPPEEEWHRRAVERLAGSGRANIALLPELHVKLFTAQTLQSSFAMLGSANFTSRSLVNREIGVLVSASGDGRALFRDLDYEASEIYRHPDRRLICKASL